MSINWLKIFREYGVDYIDAGSHVKKGNVNVHCPFCSGDQKYFMGLDLASGAWGCWWSKDHRGRSPVKLLMRLLRVSFEKAREIAGLGDSYVDPDGFADVANRLMGRVRDLPETQEKPQSCDFYREFREVEALGASTRFYRYLEDRGFDDVDGLAQAFQLKCAISGDFRNRIIIPFVVGGMVVSWTGRDIGDSTLRYRDLEQAKSILNPKEVLFNNDAADAGGKVLIVLEGQFDVMKMDFYGEPFGVRAVGLSTKSISESQLFYLAGYAMNFKRVIVMLDSAKALDVVESMSMASDLSIIRGVEFSKVPYGYKDCGEMPPGRVKAYCRKLTEEA